MKGITVDESIMEKRKKEAKIEIEDFSVYTMKNTKELLEEVKRQWIEVVENGKQIREKELLDYHHKEIIGDEIEKIKKRKKIMGRIKRTLKRNHTFRYLSWHAGKGSREMIKRVHVVNEASQITKIYVDRESVEKNIINYNKKYLTKANQSEAYLDRIYHRLKNDEIRDRILQGQVSREECDSDKVHKFLKILKISKH